MREREIEINKKLYEFIWTGMFSYSSSFFFGLYVQCTFLVFIFEKVHTHTHTHTLHAFKHEYVLVLIAISNRAYFFKKTKTKTIIN